MDDAGLLALRIAQLAGFVDLVAANAKVGGGGGGKAVVICNSFFWSTLPILPNLAPLLRLVVFFREPHFGAGADGHRHHQDR